MNARLLIVVFGAICTLLGSCTESKRQQSGVVQPLPDSAPAILSLRIGDDKLRNFILVPAGTFLMGQPKTSATRFVKLLSIIESNDYGGWARDTAIDRPFYLARTKITVAQYCQFLNAIEEPLRFVVFNKWTRFRRIDESRFEPLAGLAETAVCTVSWNAAVEYCTWMSERTGRAFRLPAEAEWEYAARGPENREYPWGDARDYHIEYGYEVADPMEVGTNPANATPLGICDMIGRVREWCSDPYYYRGWPADGMSAYRVLRANDLTYQRFLGSEGLEGVMGGIYGFRVLIETEKP